MEPTTTSITTLFNGFDLSAITHDVSSSTFSYPYTITLNPLNKKKNLIEVKSIKYSGKYTTVTWNDGTKTRVSCGENEQQSRYSAFCSALAIKIFGTNSQVKKIVETKDEQIEIDKQNKIREEQERAAKIRKARKDRLWVKKRAKELALEQRAQEMAKQLLSK
jgi:hypothetical protein